MIQTSDAAVEDYEIEIELPSLGRRTLLSDRPEDP